MRITESGLRRLIREEMRRLAGDGELPLSLPSGGTAFFMDGGLSPVKLADPAELLPMLLAAESRHPRLAFVVEGLEAAGLSFELVGRPPPGWESIAWWWPLPPGVDASSKAEVMKSPRYRSMLDAAAVSLQERGGESLRVFGRAAGLPEVGLRVVEAWEDGDHLPAGFTRKWWDGLVSGLRTESDPVEWGGSDTQL